MCACQGFPACHAWNDDGHHSEEEGRCKIAKSGRFCPFLPCWLEGVPTILSTEWAASSRSLGISGGNVAGLEGFAFRRGFPPLCPSSTSLPRSRPDRSCERGRDPVAVCLGMVGNRFCSSNVWCSVTPWSLSHPSSCAIFRLRISTSKRHE